MFVKLSVILIIVKSVIGQKQIQDWELAVVVKNEIKLLYSNGSQIDSKSQPFSSLKALAYDDIRKQFIVSDMDMENDTIYTIQLTKETDVTIPIIQELPGDVQGLAVDPIDDILYWTDASNHTINYVLLNSSVYESKPLFIFDGKNPHSLAIDVCKRYIYWTNPSHSNPTIERSRLDGKDHKILVDSFIQSPEGITIDYGSKRLYWADSRPGSSAGRIESMNLDGSDRKIVIERNTMQPFGITVDRDAIYFTDINNRGLYKFLKTLEPDDQPEKLASFSEIPMGLVTNNDAVRDIPQCNSYEQAVYNYMENGINEANKTDTAPETDNMQRCLNDGEYLGSYCKCKRGFVGKYCEHSLCYNYCFNGDCYTSSLGNPQCRCNKGYYGDRCQKNKCEGYCLNGGDCGIYSSKNMMKCQCPEGFIGDRCEYSIRVCDIYCENRESNELFSDKYELLCRCANGINFEQQNKSAAPLISESQETDYLRELNQPIIYLAASLILCILIIISLIVYIHTMSKRRPRIKKRIIVNKNVTPLTYRPQPSSEQCEITIENCCNMNICETLPRSSHDWLKMEKEFRETWNFPHCLGALDGKHVLIQSPIRSGSEFINYHSTFSIVLLALVDANYNLIFVDCGCQGRISDGGVYRNTELYQKLCRNELDLPSPECLPQKEAPLPFVFIADNTFALTENMMEPYPGTHEKGSKKRVFNYRISRARRIVENVFGIMLAVFRVLRKPMLLQPDKATDIVMTCALLHNFLRRSKHSKSLYTPNGSFDTENDDGVIQPGLWRNDVQDITSLLPSRNVPRRPPLIAKDVRDKFAEFL